MMKRILIATLLLLVTGVQTTKAQKVVLHMKGNQKSEYDVSQLDSITFCFDAPGMNPKVRIGIYETIPGYSVRDLNFYADETTDITQTDCILFANANDEVFTIDFGALDNFVSEEYWEADDYYIGRASNAATYAGDASVNYYTVVNPNEAGTDLTLRANYTLVASDSSGEIIHVTNASAQVPAEYTKWESGRAYTYIFKIHDNYTGWTAGLDVSELFPISLDAIVVENSDGSQENIDLYKVEQ